jgi:glycerate kinase
MPRRILIAPDKFKGSLSAMDAAMAIARGIHQTEPDAELDLCPIADGGEGFMATLQPTLAGKWITCPAVDPLGRPIESRYVLANTPQGLTAILEMAETAGLWRLKNEQRFPLQATTRGVGMQMAHAITEHSVARIILGLGGSATTDGGAGMAAALGVRFLDENEMAIDPTPANLHRLQRIDGRFRLALPEIIAACDVENPLLGPRGSTAIFSEQKGASADDKIVLEHALSHLISIAGGEASADIPGAGAAGGLGFGLLHFAAAKLVSGFDLLANVLDLENRIRSADHVITGEGSIDHQSLSGKGPVALARLATSLGVPVSGFCGQADADARNSGIFHNLHALADTGHPLDALMSDAALHLTQLVAKSTI